jgi:hypothetical protein
VPTSAEINRPHVVFITIDANQGLRAKKRRFRKCSDVPCKRPILDRGFGLYRWVERGCPTVRQARRSLTPRVSWT